MAPTDQPLEEELDEAAAAWEGAQRAKLATVERPGLEVAALGKYAIAADDDAFAARAAGRACPAARSRCTIRL